MDSADVTIFQFRQRLLETIDKKISQEDSPDRIIASLADVELSPGDMPILEQYALRLQQIKREEKSPDAVMITPQTIMHCYILADVGGISAVSFAILGAPLWVTTYATGVAVMSLAWGIGFGYARKKISSYFSHQHQEARFDTLLQFYGKPPGEMVH